MKKNPLFYSAILYVLIQCGWFSAAAQTDPPVIAYVTVQATTQGPFRGTPGAKDGQIECIGFNYGVETPQDKGSIVGKHQPSPLVIFKRVDASSLQFLQAINNNEPLKSVTIDFPRRTVNGRQTAAQTIVLSNVYIVKVNQNGGTGSPDKLFPGNNLMEEIDLIYAQIAIKNGDSGATISDTWSSRTN